MFNCHVRVFLQYFVTFGLWVVVLINSPRLQNEAKIINMFSKLMLNELMMLHISFNPTAFVVQILGKNIQLFG